MAKQLLLKMKIFLIIFFCVVLAIYGSEDLFVYELNPALNGGHTAEDILKISPANGLNNFYLSQPQQGKSKNGSSAQAT